MSSRTVQRDTHARHGGAGRFLRRVMLAAVIVCLGVIAALLFADRHVDEEIRRELAARIQQQYPTLRVSIDAARRVEGRGIEIHGFSIEDPNSGYSGKPLVEIDEIMALCNTDLRQLVAGDVGVRHLTIRRMTLYATRDAGGTWNVAQMLPLPKLGNNSPTATIENSTIKLVDLTSEQGAQLALRDINLTVAPQEDRAPTESQSGKWLQRGGQAHFVQSTSQNEPVPVTSRIGSQPGQPRTLHVRGTMAGDHFKHIEIDAQLDPQRGLWSARGVADRLELSPEFRRALPVDAAAQLAPLAALQCRAQLNYWISNAGGAGQPLQFVVSGTLFDGRIDDPQLPYPLTDVSAEVHCDNSGLEINNFFAQGGGATLRGSLQLRGYDETGSWSLELDAQNVTLESRLAAALPQNLEPAWRKLSPAGLINAFVKLDSDGHQFARVDCLNTSFAYDEFPLRLTDGCGRIVFEDDLLTFDEFTARASGEKVAISGQLRNPGPKSVGWVEISLERPIPIDRTMLAAIAPNEALSNVVNSFRPRGLVTFWGRFERDDPRQGKFSQNMRVGLHDCAIQYERFAYPVYKIGGTITVSDDKWEFKDLWGQNDSAIVQCNGDWTPHPNGPGGALWLKFDIRDATLEDELRAALAPKERELWSHLRPRGTIDHLGVELSLESESGELALDITAEKHAGVQDVAGRSITIHPDWFPYRLEQVTGTARFKDGVVTLTNIKAVHGATRISFSGESRCDDQKWSLFLSHLEAERLAADRDLIAALPPKLKSAVADLRLNVPVAMIGWVSLNGDNASGARPTAQWDLHFDMQNASLFAGVDLEHIFGGVRLAGIRDAAGLRCGGEVTVESLFYKDIQLTQVAGPIWIDDARVALGAWTPATGGAPPRRLTATTLNGTVEADVQFSLQGNRQYDLNGKLTGGDLALIARDTLPAGQRLSGSVQAGLRLRGSSEGPHTLVGDGWVQLRDADIYELPLMVQMLKILSVREPNPTAFTTGDVRFKVQGEHLYLNPISLQGDAVSLKGAGEIDFERNLNLRFYTLLGRDNLRPPFLRPLFDEAGRQFMRIDVQGRLNQPIVQPQPLPGIDETMQQLFPEAARAETSSTSSLPTPQGILRQVNFWPW